MDSRSVYNPICFISESLRTRLIFQFSRFIEIFGQGTINYDEIDQLIKDSNQLIIELLSTPSENANAILSLTFDWLLEMSRSLILNVDLLNDLVNQRITIEPSTERRSHMIRSNEQLWQRLLTTNFATGELGDSETGEIRRLIHTL